MDERNFHCWDYRQAVAAKAGVDPRSELDFTTDRIETNFSNYSAWHYRSKLLPLVHPSDSKVKSSNESSFPVAEEAHHKELDLVQNAAFTDPDDSSAWLYHAWLAGRGKKTQAVIWISSGGGEVSVATSQKIEAKDLATWVGGQQQTLEWEAPSRFSNLWKTKLPPGSHFEAAVGLDGQRLGLETTVARQVKSTLFEFDVAPSSKVTRSVLEEQLENCKQLLDLEPDSKWPLLTQARLMECLDKEGNHNDILATYSTLQTVDPLRRAYYRDMSSNLVIEKALKTASDFSCLDLTNVGLDVTKEQAKRYNQYLAAFETVRYSCDL